MSQGSNLKAGVQNENN